MRRRNVRLSLCQAPRKPPIPLFFHAERLMQPFLKTFLSLYDCTLASLPKSGSGTSSLPYGNFGTGDKDLGVDIVALTKAGDYWAIQCKCYQEGAAIDKPKVDTFLAASGKSFFDAFESGKKVNFTYRLWIDTTEERL